MSGEDLGSDVVRLLGRLEMSVESQGKESARRHDEHARRLDEISSHISALKQADRHLLNEVEATKKRLADVADKATSALRGVSEADTLRKAFEQSVARSVTFSQDTINGRLDEQDKALVDHTSLLTQIRGEQIERKQAFVKIDKRRDRWIRAAAIVPSLLAAIAALVNAFLHG